MNGDRLSIWSAPPKAATDSELALWVTAMGTTPKARIDHLEDLLDKPLLYGIDKQDACLIRQLLVAIRENGFRFDAPPERKGTLVSQEEEDWQLGGGV